MSKSRARYGVCYPDIQIDGRIPVVESLRMDNVRKTAGAVWSLLQQTFTAELEGSGLLPKGAVTFGLYSNREGALRRQASYMGGLMTRFAGQFWLIRDLDKPAELIGMAEVSRRDDNTRVHKIAVRPQDQGKGYGRILAHTVLRCGPGEPAGSIELTGYGGSAVNQWFEDTWGMVATGYKPGAVRVGTAHRLDTVDYATPEGVTVGDVGQRFEIAHKELQTMRRANI
jgi:GNAT superfamily N-acetyltransferase